jgi:hypothetical protein
MITPPDWEEKAASIIERDGERYFPYLGVAEPRK